MKDKFSIFLILIYVYISFLFVILGLTEAGANSRTLLLLTAFIIAVIVHISCAIHITASKTNKKFFFLSFLWGIKLAIFSINEALNFFFQKEMLVLDWIDLSLLLVIALMISVSFLIKFPFWYVTTENKISIGVGILALIFSGWLTLQAVFALVDYIKLE